jgi:hypothetical protein
VYQLAGTGLFAERASIAALAPSPPAATRSAEEDTTPKEER